MSFILAPIDFSYTTSYTLNSNFCCRTHRLTTIHSVQTTTTDNRRTQHYTNSATVSIRSAKNTCTAIRAYFMTHFHRLQCVNGSYNIGKMNRQFVEAMANTLDASLRQCRAGHGHCSEWPRHLRLALSCCSTALHIRHVMTVVSDKMSARLMFGQFLPLMNEYDRIRITKSPSPNTSNSDCSRN